MELLKSLGIDSTLWIHLACFVVAYLALSTLVFRPYLRAYQERERRTLGNEEDAVRLIEEAHQLAETYETRAKALNAQMKSVYDERRAAASKENERAIGAARDEANSILASARERIATEIENARRALSADVGPLASAIATKLAGKELH